MKNLLVDLPKLSIGREVYKDLPEGAGVYVFFKDKLAIYIGKAINLRRRVSSYFDLNLEPKTARMIREANYLSYVRVTSELEALLLEASLIRKYMPQFNIAAKDDKHPLYIQITNEKYPRVITSRRDAIGQKNLALFGPFPSSTSVRQVLRMLRRIFPYSDHKVGKRACLYSHLGLCRPCPNEIEYLKSQELKANLRKVYMKNIKRIKAVLSGKFDAVMTDLVAEMTAFSKVQNYEDASLLRNQIKKLEYITQPRMPIDVYMENPNLYEDLRKSELKAIMRILEENGNWKIKNLERVECFDIAHLAGSNPTASMATFIEGEADKNSYRHFRIRQKTGSSDVDSLREVIKRRLNHFKDWGKPDLIVVDGGIAQVNTLTSILDGNLIRIPVVGIAKHPDRLIIGKEKIKLSGPALNLVQRLRNEAHRFARRYHHELISKELTADAKYS